MRFVATLFFVGFTFVVAGCQHDRNYSTACPNCQQVYTATESPAAVIGQTAGNTVQTATFAPVPPVPVAED